MKKLLYFLLIIPILILSSCGNSSDENYDIKIDGKISHIKSFDVNYQGNSSMFVTYNNTIYHKDLAKLAIVLSSPLGNNFEANNQTYSLDELVSSIGFINPIISSKNDYDIDEYDTAKKLFAYKELKYDNQKYDLFLVINYGSQERDRNWKSNFDVGLNDDLYFDLTGNHPDWKDKNNHKGIDISTNRLIDDFNDYFESNENKSNEKIIFNVGHSRGGSIANLFGYYLEKNTDYKTFTYTFAAINVTSNTNDATTIFNVINKNDLVPYILPSTFNYHRYGTDIFIDTSDYKDELSKAINAEFLIYDISKLLNYINTDLCKNKSDLYDVGIYKYEYKFDDDLDKTLEHLDEIIDGYSKKYCKYYIEDNKVYIESCGEFILCIIDQIINSNLSFSDISQSLPYIYQMILLTPITITQIVSFYDSNIMGVVDNHNYYSYYVPLA